MNKNIVILSCLGLFIVICIVIWNNASNRHINEEPIYEVVFEEDHDFSTNDLRKISESTKYQNATTSEKEDMLKVVLDRMITDNVITEYGLQLSDNPPSIWIKYKDGSTIILQLDDYPKDQD